MNDIRKTLNDWENQLSDRNRRLWEALRFLIIFTAMVGPVYVLVWTGWNPVWLRTLHAGLSASFLELAGMQVGHSGSYIVHEAITVNVSTDSTGWKSFLVLVGLIVAYRHRDTVSKLYGIGIGAIAVLLVNQLRLVSMVLAVVRYDVSYDLLHTVLWRWGMTVSVLCIWGVWLVLSRSERTVSGGTKKPDSHSV